MAASGAVRPRAAGAALILAFVAWWAAAGFELGFYTILNDFWGLFFAADQLSLADPRTLHNGFFPIGYPLILRMLRSTAVLPTMFGVSVTAAAGTLAVTFLWLARHASPWLAVAAIAILGIEPTFFLHAITTGPDMLSTLLAATGALALLSGLARGSVVVSALGGLALGLAGLTRYHGFLMAFGAVVAGAIVWPTRWRQTLAAAAMIGMAGGVQVLANVAAGVGPFQTAQPFNVYKLFNPVDWYHLQRNYPPSVIGVIRLSPERYLEAYRAQLLPSLFLLVPSAAGAVVATGRNRRIALYALVAAGLYLPLQAVGGSPRGPLLAAPLAAVGVAVALDAILTRQWIASGAGRTLAVIGVLAAIAWASVWPAAGQNRQAVAANASVQRLWADVEGTLRADGVQHPARVFTDNFDVYFVSVRSRRSWDYRPRTTGGWAQIDLYGYDKVHPPLNTATLDAFLADCRAYGVTHLVLTPTAGYVLGPLGVFQAGGELPAQLRHVATVGGTIRIVALDAR